MTSRWFHVIKPVYVLKSISVIEPLKCLYNKYINKQWAKVRMEAATSKFTSDIENIPNNLPAWV